MTLSEEETMEPLRDATLPPPAFEGARDIESGVGADDGLLPAAISRLILFERGSMYLNPTEGVTRLPGEGWRRRRGLVARRSVTEEWGRVREGARLFFLGVLDPRSVQALLRCPTITSRRGPRTL